MAKKVNSDIPAVHEQAGENVPHTTETNVPAAAKVTALDSGFPVADEQVKQVLKIYPNYESLYVDRHGSAYTTETPATLRQGAILYKNPFYKPTKIQN